MFDLDGQRQRGIERGAAGDHAMVCEQAGTSLRKT
jgi:hypothetical protein